MKRNLTFISFVSFVAILLFASHAAAMYHPALGRFIQRDPLDQTAGGQFIGQDPTLKYRDGMSLYQYLGGNPVTWVDFAGTGKEKPDGKKPDKGGPSSGPAVEPQFSEAHFLHSVGNYRYMGRYVGHSGIGCKHKDGTMWVFDHVGHARYRVKQYKDWVDDQASNCEKGCKLTIEDMTLSLTKQQAKAFCERLAAKSRKWRDFGVAKIDVDLGWDWHGRGGSRGHNCNSSIVEDMSDTTPIKVPEKPATILGRLGVVPADYYNRWGKHTAPWLRANGHVSSETKSEHDCTGGGEGAGRKEE